MAFNPAGLFKTSIGDGGEFANEHPELTFLIGAITIQWAGLESALFVLFQAASGLPLDRAAIVFESHTSHASQRNLTARVCQSVKLSREAQDLMDEMIHDMTELSKARNRIIHDIWASNSVSGEPHRLAKFSKKISSSNAHHARVTVEEMQKLFERINTLTHQITDFSRQNF